MKMGKPLPHLGNVLWAPHSLSPLTSWQQRDCTPICKVATQDPKSQPGMHFSQQQPIRRLRFQVSPGNNSQPALADPTRDDSCAGSRASVGWPTTFRTNWFLSCGLAYCILWTWNLFNVKWFGWYHNAQHFYKTQTKESIKILNEVAEQQSSDTN